MKRLAAWSFLFIAACWYLLANVLRLQPGLGLPSDFDHYYQAGHQLLHGASPYHDPLFLYPPLVAFASTPLALTDPLTARGIWFLASHLILLAAAVLIWRYLGRGLAMACWIALVWAGGGAAGETLALGQIGPLLVLLLTLAYTTRGTTCGICAGFGAALKFIPGVLAFPLALARDWRALGSMAAATAMLLLLPALALRQFEGPQSPAGSGFLLGTPAILSWSVPSTVLRALDPPQTGARVPPNWEFGNQVTSLNLSIDHRLAATGSSLLILASAAILLAWRTRGQIAAEHLPLAMAGCLSAALAAAPVCWAHYQVLQYPGVALLLGRAWTLRRPKLIAVIIAVAAFLYPLPVAVLTRYYQSHGWTAASPSQLYFWTSTTPLACLTLFAISLGFLSPKETASLPSS